MLPLTLLRGEMPPVREKRPKMLCGVTIGSPNVSTNGMAFEGTELAGLIEGNILSRDPDILASVRQWFDESAFKPAHDVKDADIARAQEA